MTDALARLLHGVIDYAGLFPPAKLTMGEALTNYLRYRSGEAAWIMDRFVCSSARLDELRVAMEGMEIEDPISISVIGSVGGDWGDGLVHDAEAMTRFMERVGDKADIEAFEIRVPDHEKLGEYLIDLRSFNQVDVYCELPWSSVMVDSVGLIAEQDWLGAKARTGGLDANAFPSSMELATFLQQCVQLELPFKLTAGLHHPIRAYREEVGTKMHGFVNALVATSLLVANDLSTGEVAQVLDCEDQTCFAIQDNVISFGDWKASDEDIEDARSLFAAIGSCSIEEPIQDLKELKWI